MQYTVCMKIKSAFIFLFLGILSACKSSDVRSDSILEYRGADISYFYRQEQSGVQFYSNGKEAELFDILKEAGVNWIRLRLWHTSSNGWNNLEKTISVARRAKVSGFKLLLDIHYSDSWADPSSQSLPAEWETYSFDRLNEAVSSYTESVLSAFSQADCIPDMVQTGNEISNGMLWPYGKIKEGGDCSDFMALLGTAVTAVRNFCPSVKIMLHIPCDKDIQRVVWWYSQAEKYCIDYDVIGLSYYSFFTGTDFSIVSDTVQNLKKQFDKEICIAETSYPWTLDWNDNENNLVGLEEQLILGFPASREGQQRYLNELCRRVCSSGGSGVFWWEPQAVSSPSFPSSLENLTWFDFNNEYLGIEFQSFF